MAWYESLSVLEQIFFVSGVVGTLLFLIRIVLMLVGLEHGHDTAGHLGAATDIDGVHGGELDGSSDGAGPALLEHGGDVHGDTDTTPDLPADGMGDTGASELSQGGLPEQEPAPGWSTEFVGEFLQLFSLQTISTFFMMFGWFGMAFYRGLHLAVGTALPLSLAGGPARSTSWPS